MKTSLIMYSTANLSRQKKESFKLKTLLKLASLMIRKKKQ